MHLDKTEISVLGQDDEPWQKDLQLGVRTVEELQEYGAISPPRSANDSKASPQGLIFELGLIIFLLSIEIIRIVQFANKPFRIFKSFKQSTGDPRSIGDDVHRKTPLLIHRYVTRKGFCNRPLIARCIADIVFAKKVSINRIRPLSDIGLRRDNIWRHTGG